MLDYYSKRPKTKEGVREQLFDMAHVFSKIYSCGHCESYSGMTPMFTRDDLHRPEFDGVAEHYVFGACNKCGGIRFLFFPNLYTNDPNLVVGEGIVKD